MYIDFSGRQHVYTENELSAIIEIANKSNTLTQGEYLKKFEKNFVDYQNSNGEALAVTNATAALELIADLLKDEKRDEIIIPAHTYTSTAYPFVKKGWKIKWADIDPLTRNISLESVKELITVKTRAIMVVHLYGYCGEVDEIIKLSNDKDIKIIEDCAQSIGTERNSQKSGTFGDYAVFSFHSHKNMSLFGEGGIIWFKDSALKKILQMARHNGHVPFDREVDSRYWLPAMINVDQPRYNERNIEINNFCLGEIQSALGSLLLKRIDEINDEKRRRALNIIDELSDYKNIKFHRVDDKSHNYHLLVAEIGGNKRNDFIATMFEKYKVKCVVQYYPLYKYDYYIKNGCSQEVLKNTEKFYDSMISFPFQHTLTDDELSYMVQSIKNTYKEIF